MDCLFVCLFTKVMEKYSVPDYVDVHEFLMHLGKRLGKLKKGMHKLVIIIIFAINCVTLTREAIQLNCKLSNKAHKLCLYVLAYFCYLFRYFHH